MKIHYEIIQGSPEWHEMRYGKIGGTSSKGLFVDSDTLLYELVGCRMEPFILEPQGYINDAMLRGNELEPFGRMELSRKIGIKLNQAGWIEHETIKILGISPDSISEDETIQAEFKCPGRAVHIATLLANDIPANNIHQCLHAFTVNEKLKEMYFVSFRPECQIRMFHRKLTLDSNINLGTKAKPVLNTVGHFRDIALKSAEKLNEDVEKALTALQKQRI
jgi:hypothetical protein